MISQRRERQITGLMLLAYVILALTFSLGPIFEGPDEIEHYRFIRTMIQIRGLPDPYTQVRAQYHQAPLYYFIAAPLALLVNDTDFYQVDGRLNPYYPYEIGIPGNDNKNLYLHTRAESFPYANSGTARAVHLIRLLSIALGTCTVLTSAAIFRVLWPARPDRRLAALGLVAFMPQFLYLSGTINNDNLLYLLTTLTLLLLLRQRRDGPSPRLALWLGLVLGAALLTKLNAAFLVFPVGLTILMDRRSWRYVPLTAGVILLIAGWWYMRNTLLYGDPTAVRVLLETWQHETIRSGALALDIGLSRVPYGYQTFWARFGQGAVAVAQPIYSFFDLLTIVSIIGTVIALARRKASADTRQLLIVFVFGLSWIAALIYYASTAWSGNQGRYLLPGIAAWGTLAAFGMDAWTPRRLKLPVALSSAVLLAAIALICAVGYFLPSYSVWATPTSMERPLAIRYGDSAELIGMVPALPKVHPGEVTRITLYWRAVHAAPTTIQSYLHTSGSDVIKRDSLPATGNLLASDWQAGNTWAESYVVRIPSDAETQVVYPLVAGLYDPIARTALPSFDAADPTGNAINPIIGRVAIAGVIQPNETSAYSFGGVIGLGTPRINREGNRLKICLRWLSLAPVTIDYTVFIHITAQDGSPLAQDDFQPKDGRYPTGAWTPGEVVEECRSLEATRLPLSGWQVAIGLYNLENSERLPVQDTGGHVLPDEQVIIVY